ncbi:serine/threonine-protein kinase Nek11 isoform X4 [Catharus ustulatus]|uniref:serine/threonine-protein kinase Nek11 isoform X4 n=1 Tax=Catharus ustulatus TaxID=91951 RepID=UPI001407F13F|nr:serine/threonine-protein kinase Nek11 isoform X4 [Catharus ustulatus]
MLKFQETAKRATVARFNSACSEAVIARRYTVQRKLGNGSFGSVYLVNDRKAKQGEELKVLKEISVGNLKPNETVEANLEAQLLSKLDHPAIVKFYASFVERDSFCIITEYCEGGDLDFKIQEYKDSGKMFTQSQVIDWFIQLLLGVNYMHDRRILHRDLKAKNIFLKDNLLKIGDFGVSCLLMGSCDLATTFTGTPYYMSPEVLKHQGYNTKSDIWSLGCILYEMCCMNHAFTGQNFFSVVLKIVEGETPSLPERYPSNLNAVLCSMLNKNPSLRPAAAEILKSPYIDGQLKKIQYKFTNTIVKDKALNWQKETTPIFGTVQKKVHLQTLQELSEVQKMTPRERMRLRKLNAADEKAKKLKQLVEEKYQENIKRMQEFRSRNFQQLNVNVLHRSLKTRKLQKNIIKMSLNPVQKTVKRRKMQNCHGQSLRQITRSAIGKLGVEAFEAVYSCLKQARQQNASEEEIRNCLEKLVSRASDCFEVDQLLYFEEQLQASELHLQL